MRTIHSHGRATATTTLLQRSIAAALLASGSVMPLLAHAATVDLVTNIEPSDRGVTAQTFVPYNFNVRFANNAGTASNATGAIHLPANLASISLANGSGNAANCPSASTFSPVPTATTMGTEVMSSVFPRLARDQSCNYMLTVVPTAEDSAYPLSSTMQTGATDTESNAVTNTSNNPFSVTRSAMMVQVKKTLAAGQTSPIAYGSPVTFTVTYSNLSSIAIALGATESTWHDWEGTLTAQTPPASSTLSQFQCVSSVTGAASDICAAITPTANLTKGSDTEIFTSHFANQAMAAGEVITITYQRNYVAPQCGNADILNTGLWDMMAATPQWVPVSGKPADSKDDVAVSLLNPTPCKSIPLTWNAGKTLLGVERSGTLDTGNMSILANGDMAVYALTIDLTDPANNAILADTTIPTLSKTVPFNIYDTVGLKNGIMPLVVPANSVLEQMEWLSCTNGDGTNCDSKFQAPLMVQAYAPLLTPSANQYVNVDIGKKVTIRLGLRFKLQPPPTCLAQTDSLVNKVGFSVLKPADVGFMYTEIVPSGRIFVTDPVTLLPLTPYCVNLTANQSVSPMLVPTIDTPVTFELKFTNSSAPFGPESIAHAIGTSVLGADFKPTSASCKVVSGTATVPSGSMLVNISGPNNDFKADITNMSRNAVVSCTVVGTLPKTGSFQNITSIALGNSNATINGAPITGIVDPLPQDDVAVVNYMAGVVDPVVPGNVAPVPVNTPWSLALLAIMMGGLTWRQRRATKQ